MALFRFSFCHMLLPPTVMLVTFEAFFAILLIMQLNGLLVHVRSPVWMKPPLPSSYSLNPQFQIGALLRWSALMSEMAAGFGRLTGGSVRACITGNGLHASSHMFLPLPGKQYSDF